MSFPAIVVLALFAGLLGAAAESLVAQLLRSNFAARMAGLAVAALVVLAGSAGAFHLGI